MREPDNQIDELYPLALSVNGHTYKVVVEASCSVLRLLREELEFTGTKEGCDDSECGACMVLLDGDPVNSCCYLALHAAGRSITTVEGLAKKRRLTQLQARFIEGGGVQCGFCTPGMLIAATALLTHNPSPTERDIQVALAGNLCRCTGYRPIVAAVLEASREQTDLTQHNKA